MDCGEGGKKVDDKAGGMNDERNYMSESKRRDEEWR
jgi:hypothetical protein